MKRVELNPGDRFHHAVIVRRAPPIMVVKRARTAWHCLCDCGKEFVTTTQRLKCGDRTSCGCHMRIPFPRNEEGAKRAIASSRHGNVKQSARARGLSMTLTKEDVYSLIFSPCRYCGDAPRAPTKYVKHQCLTNEIDRIDSSMGYEINNCAPCCFFCNRAKNTLTIEQFMTWIKNLIAFKKSS